jgi:CRISPR/Cas system CSM-associated protein Csm3 (group 7 of RAMP superfamily)
MEKILKGEKFLNRYRFTGTLKTCSPLHIGTGESSDAFYSPDERKKILEKSGKIPEVSTIIKDSNSKPLIPGSSLRGVMRHWLLSVLGSFGDQWAKNRDYESDTWTELSQADQIAKVKEEFSWLELLFGTPFHEGKVEVWDGLCKTQSLSAPDSLLSWNPKSLTYIETSVAIDPATGTALDNLLYKTEIVPPGVEFEFNLVSQNVAAFEVGLILLVLQGFNSTIYPVQIGAQGGRGYGRLQFIPGSIYGLDAENLSAWVSSTVQTFGAEEATSSAGYYALPELDAETQQKLLKNAKATLSGKLGR